MQALAPPQPQLPAVHVFEVIGSQLAHCAPLVPQAVGEEAIHTLFKQQPLGQVAAVHDGAAQVPATHCWPPAHAGLVPHLQLPAPQVSAVESHIEQTEPPEPHMPGVGAAMQVLPEQQPVAHEVASHTHAPATQRVPVAQAAAPPQAHWPEVHESAAATTHF